MYITKENLSDDVAVKRTQRYVTKKEYFSWCAKLELSIPFS